MADTELEPPFPAYTGTEPFIFVSYSHKDATAVFPELKELHELGYRIWFDEGIDPGNEWPEEIAKAVKSSALFIVFISPNAVTSRHVKNEIRLALELGKAFLAVHICPTKLPLGLQLDLGSIQAVLKYQMSPDNYRRKMAKAFPGEVRDKASQIAHEKSPLFRVERQSGKADIPGARTPQPRGDGVLKRLKDALAIEKPEAAPPATAPSSHTVDEVADKTTPLDHGPARSARASAMPVPKKQERRLLGNGPEDEAESGSSLKPSPVHLTAPTERITAIHSQGLGTHPRQSRKSWKMVVGSVVAAVCLLAVGIIFPRARQTAPEPSARSAEIAKPVLLPEASPPEALATTSPQVVVKLEPPASTTSTSLAPEVEAPTQPPAEANPTAPASIPDAEQRAEPANIQPPEERTGPAKPKMARTRAKEKSDPVPTHSKLAMDKDAPPSAHCQTLLKNYQLGDPDSIESYRRDCTH